MDRQGERTPIRVEPIALDGGSLSSDGQRVIVTDGNMKGRAIVSFPFGGGAPTQLLKAEPGYEHSTTSITPDGRTLLFERRPLRDKINDIMILDFEGDLAPKPLMTNPLISPSGEVVAYLMSSAAEGAAVLKLVTFPTPSTPVHVSPTAVSTFGRLSASELCHRDRSLKTWSASISS